MAAISTTYDSYAYGVDTSAYASSSTSSSGGDFDAVLAGQMSTDSSTTDTGSTSAAEQALASYSYGQQAAYSIALESQDGAAKEETTSASQTDGAASTSETTSTSETAASTTTSEETNSGEESAGVGEGGEVDDTEEVDEEEVMVASGAGWPGDGTYMASWTPNGMQFYDELTGQWIDDNIPHRLNESGDLEYYWEGGWYADTATRHRMLVDGEYVEVGGEGTTDGSTQTASGGTTLDESGPFDPEYYYNADLGQWKLFNFPTRESQDGGQEYYWMDQWWTDSWDHNYAAASGDQTGSTSEQAADTTGQTDPTGEQAAAA